VPGEVATQTTGSLGDPRRTSAARGEADGPDDEFVGRGGSLKLLASRLKAI
jgi:hypothetical protein